MPSEDEECAVDLADQHLPQGGAAVLPRGMVDNGLLAQWAAVFWVAFVEVGIVGAVGVETREDAHPKGLNGAAAGIFTSRPVAPSKAVSLVPIRLRVVFGAGYGLE